jgi:hypothetical protein
LRHAEELAIRCDADVVFLREAESPDLPVGCEEVPVTVYHQEVERRT